MNFRKVAIFCFGCLLASAGVSQSQELNSWVVIRQADDSRSATGYARLWALQVDGIHALRDRSGRFSVAIGPLEVEQAQQLILQLAATGQIPNDSRLASSSDFAEVIWPPSAVERLRDRPGQEIQPAPIDEITVEVDTGIMNREVPRTESLAEARERELSLPFEELLEIQRSLRLLGFYASGIDGRFGPGTRQAISAYQRNLGEPETGYLTGFQMDRLFDDYRTEFSKFGYYSYSDSNAGIRMTIPGALVEFARYSPPFAIFEPSDDRGVRLLLISFKGGTRHLEHLYEVVTMFEAVPDELDGEKSSRAFEILGQNEQTGAYAYATRNNGSIKGFLATWPAASSEFMDKSIPVLKESFQISAAGTLDDLVEEEGFVSDSVDLLAGLETRRPDAAASGFYFDSRGHVMTVRDAVANCRRILVESGYEMSLSKSGTDSIAILSPRRELSPIEYAKFSPDDPGFGDSVSVSGYSFGGRLGAPTLTKGVIRYAGELPGNGQSGSISVNALDGDPGGPILNSSGAVVGMLLPSNVGGRQLPDGEFLFAGSKSLTSAIRAAGGRAEIESDVIELAYSEISRKAADMTVLVKCYM